MTLEEAKQCGAKRFTGKLCTVDGHGSIRYVSTKHCVVCSAIKAAKWATDNPDKQKQRARNWKTRNKARWKARKKQWELSNPDKVAAAYVTRSSKLAYRKAAIERVRKWVLNNPNKAKKLRKYTLAMYRTKLLHATPLWVDRKEIRKIYDACPLGYQVDHIVPLGSKHVCGLHVPWNLQYLTPLENVVKSNKLLV